jgi:anaerobic ribonucleoside-triphosphate reductase activating protein
MTHAYTGGELLAVDVLFERLMALGDAVEGLTVSGGEPFQQRHALLALLQQMRRETQLSVLVFTGFSWEEVQCIPEAGKMLACIDVLIAGRYDHAQRLARDLRGSANKTVHLLSYRYTMADIQAVPPAEVIVTATGDVLMSGIDPVRW